PVTMTAPAAPVGTSDAGTQRSGLAFAISAYALWGLLPIFFLALAPAGSIEIVSWRVLFSLVFCALIIVVTRSWRKLFAIVKQPRLVLLLGLAGALVLVNWLVYVYATLSGHVVEGS